MNATPGNRYLTDAATWAPVTVPSFTTATSGAPGAAGLVPGPNANATPGSRVLTDNAQWRDLPMVGATSSTAGTAGIVPAPSINANPGSKFLADNATWSTPVPASMSAATTGAGGNAGIVPASSANPYPGTKFLTDTATWVSSNPVGFMVNTTAAFTYPNNSITTVIYNTSVTDTVGGFNTATGVYTCKVAGYYSVDWFIIITTFINLEVIALLQKNGTSIAWSSDFTPANNHYTGAGGSMGMLQLGVGDTINVAFQNTSGVSAQLLYNSPLQFFNAFLIR